LHLGPDAPTDDVAACAALLDSLPVPGVNGTRNRTGTVAVTAVLVTVDLVAVATDPVSRRPGRGGNLLHISLSIIPRPAALTGSGMKD